MCGIIGILGEARAETAEAMLRSIAHRGRDDRQWRRFDRFGLLGINRLSIMDLHRGEQPIFNEDGTLAVVCNGEIYNQAAIRRDLADDHELATRSDIEVILHLYEEYGDDAVKFLDGMFAFILFDFRRGRVLLGRDAIGIKPGEILEPGRTFDMFGDYPVLMEQIAGRGDAAREALARQEVEVG